MEISWIYAIISVIIVSLVSLVGVFILSSRKSLLENNLLYLVSFATGAILGNVFLHLIPEIVQTNGFGLEISLYILAGLLTAFVIEKIVHWKHMHKAGESHVHPISYLILIGDGIHNFIDGMIIGAVYLTNIPIGIATTISIIFHEIPQEIGDFSILINSGMTRAKALFYNFVSALTALLGTAIVLVIGSTTPSLEGILIPFAVGNFIYIAAADLIPEMHKETELSKSAIQFLTFLAGIGIMLVLALG
jgi:zinc and cadmium transporter